MAAEVGLAPPMSHNGHGPHTASETTPDLLPSRYLDYLPPVYHQDSFMGRFLRIFEDILSPIQDSVSRRADYFDPALATPALLDVMAAWIGADSMGELTEERKRGLLQSVVSLNRLRGTKQGLRLALETVTGKRPYITEYSPGLVLGEDAALGINTSLQDGVPLQIHIVFDCSEAELETGLVHATIQRYKPAETIYTVSYVT